MTNTEETFSIACKGGLDLTTNTQELLNKPGWATRLLNFEPSTDGGYRRISGYEPLGDGRTPGVELTHIKGVQWVDNRMLIACHESSIYLTYNLTDWIMLNKDMDLDVDTDGLDYTEMLAATEVPRASSYNYDFQIFRQGTEVIVMGVSDEHRPFYAKIVGTDLEDSMYSYKELELISGDLVGASQTEKYKDQFVIAGMTEAPAEIYYSDILAPDDFEGGNAGAIGFNDTVVGLQMFRESLYVFCENSIHKIDGLSSGTPERIPVTTKIGCVDGNSIQELAGDLVFLAPDGLRTLSATVKIGDVNISTLSTAVAGRLRVINQEIATYDVRSETLKNKAQYRIFFKSKPGLPVSSYSLIMYLGVDNEGNQRPEFSEISGFDVLAIDNGFYLGKEHTVTGDVKGNLWFHDKGHDWNGRQIYFLYENPFFAIDDPGSRKNIHKIVSYLKLEGDVNFNIAVKYDYDSTASYQPSPYPVGPLYAPAVYGDTIYAEGTTYGTEKAPIVSTLTEGSGKTMAIRIFPSGETCAPFSLQGFDVHYVPSGRL